MQYSLITWNEDIEKAPMDEYVLLYVDDDIGDYSFKYVTIAWKTIDGRWIMDNEYILGNIMYWAKLPDPEKIFQS